MVRPMSRNTVRGSGTIRRMAMAMLALFGIQMLAVSLCALPDARAASTAELARAVMHANCPMDMSAEADRLLPRCDHCAQPDSAPSVTPAPESPSWLLAAILPEPQSLQDQPATPATFPDGPALASAPPGSAALIFRHSRRIRI